MNNLPVDPNSYIFFEPDQVLTNDHLNQLFGYLDQQERWTRNKLIGVGIACGLEVSYESSTPSISISGGCGITSQGYLINDCPGGTYNQVIQYIPKSLPPDLPFKCASVPFYNPPFDSEPPYIYQLLDKNGADSRKPDPCADCLPANNDQKPTAQSQPQPLSSVKDLSKYLVVLFLEIQEKDLKNCDTQDCNNKGKKLIFNLIPLLVPVQLLVGKDPKDPIPAKPKEIKLKRYNVPYKNLLNADQVLDEFYALMEKDTLIRIESALAYCYDYTAAFFPDAPQKPFDPNDPGKFIAKIIENYRLGRPVLMQYLYDFLNDLILAYYEFRGAASCVDVACCIDECKFPLHLVLGQAGVNIGLYEKDLYRQYFIKVAGGCCCQSNELSELEFLLIRIDMMLKEFISTFKEWEALLIKGRRDSDKLRYSIKVTPSQYEMFPLSERAIPYYYVMDTGKNNLYEYWNFHKTTHGNAAFNLGYNSEVYNNDDSITDPLNYDIEKYNFFRIEGHIGQLYTTVLAELRNQIKQYNLPFNVVAVCADRLVSGKTSKVDFFSDYFLQHPGLEHKAGVPKGGTFVLVFHEQARQTFREFELMSKNSNLESMIPSEVSLSNEQAMKIINILGDCAKATQTDFGNIVEIFIPPATHKYDIGNGAVIADFYIPYLCCAGSTNEPLVYNVTGGGHYCQDPAGNAQGFDVGLDGSDTGVSYQLYRDGEAIGAPKDGSGQAFSFGTQSNPGLYTAAIAINTVGSKNTVSGSVSITANDPPAAITGDNVNNGKLTITVSSNESLSCATPNGTWKSSNPTAATIDPNGNLRAIAAGQSTITYTLDTGCFSSITVNVFSIG